MFQNILKILVLVVLFQSQVFSQQTFQYNLKANDSFVFHQKTEQSITQDFDGTDHVIENSIEDIFTIKVKKVTDSSYVMNFEYQKFAMNSQSNLYGTLFKVNTDSTNAKNAQSKIFSVLTHSVLSFEMLKCGKILYFKGTDKLIENMINNAGFEDDYTKAVMGESMKKEFGNEKMINSLEQFTYFYSKKPVSSTDSWSTKINGDLKATNTWKIKSIDKSMITITGSSNVSLDSNQDSMKMALIGTGKTTINVNKTNGMPNSMEVVSNLEGSTTITGDQPMKIPTKITSLTTYKAQKNVQ